MFRTPGRKQFNRCEVKVVEFSRYAKHKEEGFLEDAEAVDKLPPDERKNYFLFGYTAELDCPRTIDERIKVENSRHHKTQVEALEEVGNLAGRLLCQNCRYHCMDPVAVSTERAALTRAEAERLEAVTERESALKELKEVNPEFNLLR